MIPGDADNVIEAGVIAAEEAEATRLLAMSREARHANALNVIRGIASEPQESPGAQEIYLPDTDTLYWAGIVTDQVDFSYDSGRKAATELLKRLDLHGVRGGT